MRPRVYLDPLPMYLTGASNSAVRAVARARGIGLLLRPGAGYQHQTPEYAAWAADNGQYTAVGTPPTDAEWWTWLERLVAVAGPGGLFATAPDVLRVTQGPQGPTVVGDAAATLARSLPWLRRIRGLGLPAALVAQDGAEDLDLPWAEFDVLFLGGSTGWKLGPRAAALTGAALDNGLRVHMGRVNSARRVRLAASWGVSTVDGTYLAFAPDRNLPRLLSWYGHPQEGEHECTDS